MSFKELQQLRERLQRRLINAIVLAIGLLVLRQFTTTMIVVFAFFTCVLYTAAILLLWSWVLWQLAHR
ncbi:hypothetical protein [Furfurilactobacillus siliginis]|uniref:Uncharacterized protein n=1 Tax=Furfurilactobacillus siliginis TaxID=348151 RepID=A0A0R2LEU3_9LACO|nr:hypothetical protein [Furfurilactobacillus siliginis]KRN96692.1 hypothetical protein IV55_GL001224 [Furfurilactobacillus siliginis]GEK29465.1 hypothetical protein LSI01_17760 [Furfurilactobacillus siliginis]